MIPVDIDQLRLAQRNPGRRARSRTQARSGRHLRSVPYLSGERDVVLDLSASLRASLLRAGVVGGVPQPTRADLRRKLFQRRQQALIVFVVDASESMGEGSLVRMQAAKGAILALLTSAYQNRDRVALVAFRNRQAEVVLTPTSSVLLARERLRRLAIGGATPFADGLQQAWQLVGNERQKNPGLQPLLVIVSDGEANVPLATGADVFHELTDLAEKIRKERIASIVIDSGTGPFGSDNLCRLATALGAPYRRVRELDSLELVTAVREAGE